MSTAPTRPATALAVMARYPELGKVKTRLARTIGARRALALYRAFLLDLDERFADRRHQLVWMYEPDDAPFAEVVRPGSVCLPQQGANLAQRMRHCFDTLLKPATGGFDHVIMIGADVPHVRDSSIEEADRRLDDHDVVLGPSADGGYYLIALSQPCDLFSMIDMGTSRVLEQTIVAVRAAGRSAYLLPQDFDVDDEEDLERLRLRLAESDAPHLPHTMALLDGTDS